jgi:hypothetical protein
MLYFDFKLQILIKLLFIFIYLNLAPKIIFIFLLRLNLLPLLFQSVFEIGKVLLPILMFSILQGNRICSFRIYCTIYVYHREIILFLIVKLLLTQLNILFNIILFLLNNLVMDFLVNALYLRH